MGALYNVSEQMMRDRARRRSGERTAGRADSAIEGTPETFERHRSSARRSRPVADRWTERCHAASVSRRRRRLHRRRRSFPAGAPAARAHL